MTYEARAADRTPSHSAAAAADRALIVAVVLLVVADLTGSAISGQWGPPIVSVVYYLAMAALLVAGSVSLRTPGRQRMGRLLLGIASASTALDLLAIFQDVGPATFISGLFAWVVVAMFAHALLGWPEGRLQNRVQRWTLIVAYLVLPVLTLASIVFWDRAWFGSFAAHWWWPTLGQNRGLSVALFLAGQVVYFAVIGTVVALTAQRLVRAPAHARGRLVPVAIAAVFLALPAVVGTAQSLGWTIPVDAMLLQNLGILILPLAVLYDASGRAPLSALPPPVDAA